MMIIYKLVISFAFLILATIIVGVFTVEYDYFNRILQKICMVELFMLIIGAIIWLWWIL